MTILGSHHSVKSLAKGLAILEAVGHLGKASAAQIASAMAIPRPTAHRLLETLFELGYVQREGLRDGYSLALRVRALAFGCRDDDWIAEIAEPHLAMLSEEVVWPCDIATYQNGAMMIRATTHRRSPLSLERISNGHLVSMLATATGRAYLAFCSDAERSAIIETLDSTDLPERDDMRHPLLLQRELDATRLRGYGVRIRGIQPKTSSIAAPVMAGNLVVACVNINWIDSAVELATILQRHLKPLLAAANGIAAAYSRAMHESDLTSRSRTQKKFDAAETSITIPSGCVAAATKNPRGATTTQDVNL
ncbi:helix-turn-helix domain-containing protein [Diaphorobacter sp. HDW4A]|uniref:helix-turn-helix domain-containing protein n=1 Tax=Diaphorobacter sp. HDW4A TaxID=2714924 RepID=UPI0014086A14|nr:helix-turn-helix domain-containing protein [Diaphorobacter sp. HDW4A]QIL79418.1 helix-turn-helix domain-containing protein [Diaphorobacter sp. HDW4A]